MASYCPNCLAENTVGALICKQCGTLFTAQGSSTISPKTESAIMPKETAATALRTAHIGRLRANSIALYIAQLEQPIIVDVISQATLGRGAMGSDIQPTVDLNPFGAYDKGVSRIHAILRRKGDSLTIEDNGSSNGTWVNGHRIEPFTPTQLSSSNEVRLGQLSIQVYLNTEPDKLPKPAAPSQETQQMPPTAEPLSYMISLSINKENLEQLTYLNSVVKQLIESGKYQVKLSVEAINENNKASSVVNIVINDNEQISKINEIISVKSAV